MLRKLEQYEETISDYPKMILEVIKRIESRVDKGTMEEVEYLAEMVYKEGFKDGLHFMDWLKI